MTTRLLLRLLLLVFLCAAVAAGAAKTSTPEEQPFDDTTTIKELFDLARGGFGLDNFDLAETCYREILIRETANLQAMLELANVYERGGKLEYALGLLGRAVKLAPNNQDIANRQRTVEKVLALVLDEEIDDLMESGQYESAIAKIVLRISIGPETGGLIYKKALCLTETGQLDAAMTEVEAAISIAPDERYHNLRNRVSALQTAFRVEDLQTRVAKLISESGDSQHEAALNLLGQILKLDPDNEWARGTFVELSGVPIAKDTSADSSVNGRIMAGVDTLVSVARRSMSFLLGNLALILGFLAVVLVFRSPLTLALQRQFTRQPLLSGQLSRFSLTEILLMLNAEPHTGILTVKCDGCRGKVYFDSGEPRHCVVGKLDGSEALIHLINNAEVGYFAFSEGALSVEHSIEIPLSLILIEQVKTVSGSGASVPRPRNVRKSKMKELLDARAE